MAGKIARNIRSAWNGVRRVGLGLSIRTVLYPLRRAWYERRFRAHERWPVKSANHALREARSASEAANLEEIGDVLEVMPMSQGVALRCSAGYITLEAITSDICRLRIVREPPMPAYFSYATVLEPQVTASQLDIGGDTICLRTDSLHFCFNRRPLRLSVCDSQGQTLQGEISSVAWYEGNALLYQRLPAGIQFYGMGERACMLNCRGEHFHLTTTDPEGYHLGDDPLYKNIPFVINLYEGRASGVFFDSTYDGIIDLGSYRSGYLEYLTTGPELRLDFFAGPNIATVIERYTALTGRMMLPPRWALGYHQSRWSYESEPIVRKLAQQFRQRAIPCDAIHLDIDYMDGFRCFTWDSQAFPDPPGLISFLHDQNFKVVGMIDPGIKVDPDYTVCADGVEHDMFCKLPDGSLFHGPVWPGECYFPDFTSSRIRAWWGNLYRSLLEDGFDGFWNDMNEPAIFGRNTFPGVVRHELEGRQGNHLETHSAYGMQMVRASFEGLNQLRPNTRNWLFTRSGYAGVQRYASTWSGDNYSDWQHLRLTPAMLMNTSLSGLSFTGADIGGFTGTPSPELFARWISMAAFTPFFRTHSAKHTPPQEPWSYGSEVESIARDYIGWRYRLLPYLYTAFWQCSQTGLPIMRPLLFEDQNNPTYLSLDDQWLLGDHLLISPVLTHSTAERTLHLPAGTWYDFWNNTIHNGPDIISYPSPLNRVPIHIRAGTSLTLGPIRQFAGERPETPLQLHIYPGNGTTWLYEDDGHSLAYKHGSFRKSRFQLEQTGKILRLSRSYEGSFVPAYQEIHLVICGAHIESVRYQKEVLAMDRERFSVPRDGWQEIKIILT